MKNANKNKPFTSFLVGVVVTWLTVLTWNGVMIKAQLDPSVDFVTVYNLVEDALDANGGIELAQQCLRASFHDAMSDVTGSMSGSPDHNGLENCIAVLRDVYNNNAGINSLFSQPNFFAWAYVAVFYYILDDSNVPWVPLHENYGGGSSEQLPPDSGSGSPNHQDVLNYFNNLFGLNEQEVATLLGAHTIGGAQSSNSGFRNDWTNSPESFNAAYYSRMIDPPGNDNGWEQVELPNGKFQWMWGCVDLVPPFDAGVQTVPRTNLAGCRELMLNVDMQLLHDMDDELDDATGKASLPDPLPVGVPANCGVDGRMWAACFPLRTNSATSSTVQSLDGNRNGFLNDFAPVFGKMLGKGSSSELSEPSPWPPSSLIIRGNGGPSMDSDDGGGNGFRISVGCFSLSTTVTSKTKGIVSMKELQVGDEILTRNGQYEAVYAIPHYHPTKVRQFVQIQFTTSSQSPNNSTVTTLEMTSDHLIYVKNKDHPIPASMIQVNDVLLSVVGNHFNRHDPYHVPGDVIVTKIVPVTKNGYIAPLTKSGTLVVDGGIVASSYITALPEEMEYFEIFDVPVLHHHVMMDIYFAPYRLFCQGIFYHSPCTDESRDEDGRTPYLRFGDTARQWLVQTEQRYYNNNQNYSWFRLLYTIVFMFLFGPIAILCDVLLHLIQIIVTSSTTISLGNGFILNPVIESI